MAVDSEVGSTNKSYSVILPFPEPSLTSAEPWSCVRNGTNCIVVPRSSHSLTYFPMKSIILERIMCALPPPARPGYAIYIEQISIMLDLISLSIYISKEKSI